MQRKTFLKVAMARKTKRKSIKNNSSSKRGSATRPKGGTFLRKGRETQQKLSPLEVRHLIEELHKSQSEVKGLNEELRKLQERLEASRKICADLYDFAPIGYFTLDQKGQIVEVNLTGANMLGLDRRLLINKPFSAFVDKDDLDVFLIHRTNVFKELCHLTCEIRMKRKDGTIFTAKLQSIALEDINGNLSQCRTALIPLSERRKAHPA
jgi:PAS domain S-box-containing protein